jgi:hypothetical protein
MLHHRCTIIQYLYTRPTPHKKRGHCFLPLIPQRTHSCAQQEGLHGQLRPCRPALLTATCRRFYVPEPVSILLVTVVQGSAGLLSAERAGIASYGPICCGAGALASSAPGPAVCHAICCAPGSTSCQQRGRRLFSSAAIAMAVATG